MKNFPFILIALCNTFLVNAQFAPQVGIEGHEGIYKDSSVFINWATGCTLVKGFQNIDNPTLGVTTIGDVNSPLGKINGAVVSLGDGGSATLTFEHPIYNGEGVDFAIFENGFLESTGSEMAFLELGFVEVSSDGINFFRFPSVSNVANTNQLGGFANTNAREIHNFAGKYISNYGTPFDLEDLKDETALDINHITHVKIIDVVGSIDPKYASYDSKGNIVNDPFPTPFPSGGLDLAGIGVIHQKIATSLKQNISRLEVYPNPANNYIQINLSSKENFLLNIFSLAGQNVMNVEVQNQEKIDISTLAPGSYIVIIKNSNYSSTFKWTKL